jgi:hypothetical protein
MKYSKGWKYRVEGAFAYELQCEYKNINEYESAWFSIQFINQKWWLIVWDRYAWNGANSFPDFNWILAQSCLHDALHEAIDVGAIGEEDNDTIDLELDIAIQGNKAARASKKALFKFRGWYVRKATNTSDQKQGGGIKVYELPKMKHEYTLQEFALITKK